MIGFEIPSPAAQTTREVGRLVGEWVKTGTVIALVGDLGAGKTTFAAGLGLGWGSHQPITSPTFVIVHEHHRPADGQLLYHLDAYRLTTPTAADSIALEDILAAEAVVLIEWADLIAERLPADSLWITFSAADDPDQRQLWFEGLDETRLAELREFLAARGQPCS
jgi:tRNA threonylcarbamoyladenosine biosynthesis protein TsaE